MGFNSFEETIWNTKFQKPISGLYESDWGKHGIFKKKEGRSTIQEKYVGRNGLHRKWEKEEKRDREWRIYEEVREQKCLIRFCVESREDDKNDVGREIYL